MNEQAPQRNQEPGNQIRPRIWVGSLADYNAGQLHGEWLDAAVDDTALHEAVQRIIAASPQPDAEEWAIFDFDGFGGYRVNEYDPIEEVAAIARGIAQHGAAFGPWAEIHDGNADMLAAFEDNFLGTYASAADWVREVVSELGIEDLLDKAVPETFRSYVSIDYESFADDERLSGTIHIESTPDGGVWIFRVI